MHGKASLGDSWWYPRVSAAFWIPLKRVCCIDGQKRSHTSSYGVSMWTSKWVNVSISVSDPGWPPGNWNLMQFLVKHSGAERSSGQGESLQGEEFCEDWRNATKEQKTPCGTNWHELKWMASGTTRDARCWSISWGSIVRKRQGIKYSSLPMRSVTIRRSFMSFRKSFAEKKVV